MKLHRGLVAGTATALLMSVAQLGATPISGSTMLHGIANGAESSRTAPRMGGSLPLILAQAEECPADDPECAPAEEESQPAEEEAPPAEEPAAE
jgi:hypothetical protein